MRSSCKEKAFVAAALVGLLGGSGSRPSTAEESKRKVKTKATPVYPDLAKRMNVGGKVKVEVTMAAEGHVKGHPLLVQACPGRHHGKEICCGSGGIHPGGGV
jgi:hypothetical protein